MYREVDVARLPLKTLNIGNWVELIRAHITINYVYRGYMNFIFECSTRYRVEQEKIKFISISGHVICSLYKHTNDDDFRRFPTTFRRFPKIFQNCCEGQTNIFRTFAEDCRRFPIRGGTDDVSIIQQHI